MFFFLFLFSFARSEGNLTDVQQLLAEVRHLRKATRQIIRQIQAMPIQALQNGIKGSFPRYYPYFPLLSQNYISNSRISPKYRRSNLKGSFPRYDDSYLLNKRAPLNGHIARPPARPYLANAKFSFPRPPFGWPFLNQRESNFFFPYPGGSIIRVS